MNSSNRLDIFQIYCRYCEITLEAYSLGENDYRPAKAKVYRDALSQLLQLVESTVDKRCVSSAVNGNDRRCVLVKTDEDCVVCNYSTPVLEELPLLMSRLDLMADSSQFSRFYNFVFFICREDGQRSITVSRAIMAWKLVLSGRFRLLNQWCNFIEKNQRHNISEDTWRQVLAFSRCVHENLEGYDPEGAWPVLIDEFVEHMYRINGSQVARSLCCNCDDSETQPIDDSLPGLKIFPGVKRKFGEDLQDQEFTNINTTIMNTKRRHTDLADTLVNREGYLPSNPTYDCTETVKQNNPTGTTTPPCAVDGSLSKGFAELFSSMSCLQFDRETRVPYTM